MIFNKAVEIVGGGTAGHVEEELLNLQPQCYGGREGNTCDIFHCDNTAEHALGRSWRAL